MLVLRIRALNSKSFLVPEAHRWELQICIILSDRLTVRSNELQLAVQLTCTQDDYQKLLMCDYDLTMMFLRHTLISHDCLRCISGVAHAPMDITFYKRIEDESVLPHYLKDNWQTHTQLHGEREEKV